MKEYWSLFERLLHQSLVPHWTAIVKQECKTNGHVTTNGMPKTGKRGKIFASINWCIRTWLRKVTKANAAERHRSYMQSQIIWPIKHIDVGLFIERVVEMNSYLVYLIGVGAEQCKDASMKVSLRWRIIVEGSIVANVVNYLIFGAAGRENLEAG